MSAPVLHWAFDHAVLFTGHMIDAPGRKTERFPARAEAAARLAIEDRMAVLLSRRDGEGAQIIGIAGGANGGDILFHEVCESFKVPTLLRLALPVEEYIAASVAPAGGDWVARFHTLLARMEPGRIAVLDDSVELPRSLTGGAALNIWQQTNLWMVEEALGLAPHRTLLALWDGNAGDGPGGTEHLVKLAPSEGIDVVPIIRTQAIVPPLA